MLRNAETRHPEGPKSAGKKRKQFSLEEKLRIVAKVDSGKKQADVAKEFQVSRSTLATFLKDRVKIEEQMREAALGPQRKRMRTALHEDLEKAVFTWFRDTRAKNVPVSGALIREKALEFGKSLGYDNFQASIGWLNRFRDRYGITARSICGEEKAVPLAKVNEWRSGEVMKILAEYSNENIYNADETGMFYQLLPNRTLAVKGDLCKGGKKSKQRLTVLLCCNASGTDKMKPLVIGKSAKPRCFKNVKSLPCDYRANTRAWMTNDIFKEWLIKFDKKMQREERHILLLVDNCSAHNVLPRLTYIRVEYLPPNCTSVLQPLDLGIIQAVKLHYRSMLVKRILTHIDKDMTVDVHQAINMIATAWSSIKVPTIAKCWAKSGNVREQAESNLETEDDIDDPLDTAVWRSVVSRTDVPEDVTFHDFAAADDDLSVCQDLTESDILTSVTPASCSGVSMQGSDDSDSEADSAEAVAGYREEKPTARDALSSMDRVRHFITTRNGVPDEIFQHIAAIESYLLASEAERLVQPKITFFLEKQE